MHEALSDRPALSGRPAFPDWVDRAVLIFGPRKGGTTLFQNLLDGGDGLLVYPEELKLKYFARKLLRSKTVATYIERNRMPLVKSSRLDLAKYTSLWASLPAEARWPVADLVRFDAWCLSQACPAPPRIAMWCAKEVGGGRRDVLAFWRQMFAPGKAVFIVRDPLMVIRAILNDRRKKDRRLSRLRIFREVLEVLRTLERQSRYLEDPNVHFTVFEELVANPEQEMRKVAGFLGIPYTPALARPTLFGEPIVVRTASQATTEVFRSDVSWRDGLTSREQSAVLSAMRVARLIPASALDYEGLKRRIASRAV